MALASLPVAVILGVPGAGVNEVQGLTTAGTVTGGTFRLNFQGFTTSPISWTATTAILETALNNLKSIASGGTGLTGVVVTGGNFPGTAFVVTFSGTAVAKKELPLLVLQANDLVGGGTVNIVESTAGVNAFGRGYPPGTQVIKADSGVVYYNSGTADQPVWLTVA